MLTISENRPIISNYYLRNKQKGTFVNYDVDYESKLTFNNSLTKGLEYALKPNQITIESICFEDCIFELNSPLVLEINYSENLFYIRNDKLDIEVWGETKNEALEAFNFAFYANVKNYVYENEEKLTDKAIQLRNTLIELVDNLANEN